MIWEVEGLGCVVSFVYILVVFIFYKMEGVR